VLRSDDSAFRLGAGHAGKPLAIAGNSCGDGSGIGRYVEARVRHPCRTGRAGADVFDAQLRYGAHSADPLTFACVAALLVLVGQPNAKYVAPRRVSARRRK
jgi:hypothetical protein